MTTIIRALEPGSDVSALFRDDLYGVFMIQGKVVRSTATGVLMVGGWLLEAGKQPPKELLSLSTDAEPEEDAAEDIASSDPEHGDLVRASFKQDPYGAFTVTGRLVETADRDMALVGRWIVRRGGDAGRYLVGLSALSDHMIPVPRRIAAWRNSDPEKGAST